MIFNYLTRLVVHLLTFHKVLTGENFDLGLSRISVRFDPAKLNFSGQLHTFPAFETLDIYQYISKYMKDMSTFMPYVS